MAQQITKLKLKKLPGRVYKKYRKLEDGSRVYCDTWTVRYKGKDHSTGTPDEKEAESYLRKLIGGAETGKEKPWKLIDLHQAATAQPTGVLLSEILDVYVEDSQLRELSSASGNEGIVRNYLKPFFGEIPARELSKKLVTRYQVARIKSEPRPANGTVNREVAALKRAVNLSMDDHTPPLHFPKIDMLPEATPRDGILEHRDYVQVRHAMPAYWEPVFVCAYHVGRRRGELVSIELADVVMDAEQPYIRVSAATTKNKKPSQIPIYGDMIEVLRKQIEMTKRDFPNCKLLFHKDGNFIHKHQWFYRQWNNACKAAGVPGLLFHDLRRTACTMLIEAGNDEQEAMRISGHKTPSAFRRYHIVRSTRMTTTVNRAAVYLAAEQAKLVAPGSQMAN